MGREIIAEANQLEEANNKNKNNDAIIAAPEGASALIDLFSPAVTIEPKIDPLIISQSPRYDLLLNENDYDLEAANNNIKGFSSDQNQNQEQQQHYHGSPGSDAYIQSLFRKTWTQPSVTLITPAEEKQAPNFSTMHTIIDIIPPSTVTKNGNNPSSLLSGLLQTSAKTSAVYPAPKLPIGTDLHEREATALTSNVMMAATAAPPNDSFSIRIIESPNWNPKTILQKHGGLQGIIQSSPFRKNKAMSHSRSSSIDERTHLLQSSQPIEPSTIQDIFKANGNLTSSSDKNTNNRDGDPSSILDSLLKSPIDDTYQTEKARQSKKEEQQQEHEKDDSWISSLLRMSCNEATKSSTWIGAFMALLYNVVFCLAMGSSIIRPNSDPSASLIGLMAKMAALGVLFGAPVYFYNLHHEIPAMYPSADLFLAPFLANIAVIVDQVISEDKTITSDDNDTIFLSTFAFLASMALLLSGSFLLLSSVFKLANLGSFLPFPVLCGFFSAVAILTWSLAFSVDTNGKNFKNVFSSGDSDLILNSIIHHAPSFVMAIAMKWLGPKNPFYVVMVVFASIVIFHTTMLVSGVSLQTAREQEWFWSPEALVHKTINHSVGFAQWVPPAPFGVINMLFCEKVHWGAVWEGLQTTFALAFLYLIRCSLHGAALKKNIPNLSRVEKEQVSSSDITHQHGKTRTRTFSEIVDVEDAMQQQGINGMAPGMQLVEAVPTCLPLQDILMQYGYSQLASAVVGSFAIVPSVAASSTMYTLGAEGVAPQLASVFFLAIFYITDFRIVAYIPKIAFSSMLNLAFLDMIYTWFFKSYFKTKEKMEWLVVPLIVFFAFYVGILGAVFLGIAMSTFLFAASFFRSGVVKYIASGLTIRSTIERPNSHADCLNINGDMIQVIVLQNYLCFGNASSMFNFISSMFEEPDHETHSFDLPPLPKYIILDMTLVTGMDTSTADVIIDLKTLCKTHNCKLFLSGINPNLRAVLTMAGVKPERGARSKRTLRFFSNIDTALGKAEDMLLENELRMKNMWGVSNNCSTQRGFRRALRCIDEQHDTHFYENLVGLEQHTKSVDILPNEGLYEGSRETERGLFFIEAGIMKIERDTSRSVTKTAGSIQDGGIDIVPGFADNGSLGAMKSRTGEYGREIARLKASTRPWEQQQQNFRLARLGVGWVVGMTEAVSGVENPGVHIAVTRCRLHHLPYWRMKKLEKDDPVLMLHLYKLLSYLMAKRKEVTIGQLATLKSIMSSPAKVVPINRKASEAFQGI